MINKVCVVDQNALIPIDIYYFHYSFSTEVFVIHLSALVEVCLASVATLLIVEPTGTLQIKSCRSIHLSDWYTLLHNPNPHYGDTLHCTQEAVYPL